MLQCLENETLMSLNTTNSYGRCLTRDSDWVHHWGFGGVFFCVVFRIACLVSNLACVSRLSNLDCPSVFANVNCYMERERFNVLKNSKILLKRQDMAGVNLGAREG